MNIKEQYANLLAYFASDEGAQRRMLVHGVSDPRMQHWADTASCNVEALVDSAEETS